FEGRPLTTRALWLNPLVFLAYRIWAQLPMRQRAQRPVFILGMGRSGTTVLGRILALHRDVGYLNEPKALWQAALGNDDLIGSYSKKPGRYRMNGGDLNAAKKRRLHRFYRVFLWLTRSRRIVDKYPELMFRDGLIDAAFPQARKVLLLRNGADTIRSVHAWSQNHSRNHDRRSCDDWWGRDRRKWHLLVDQLVAPDPYFAGALRQIRALSRQMDMAAVEWIVTMREAARLLEQQTAGLMVVRYEDLVAHPRRTLGEILRFCDLATDEVMLRFGANVLQPRPSGALPDLDAAIAPLFADTMRALGYALGEAA
ncbi:MAG: sulfotransferase, partial [Paracoccaceae bacterium]